MVADVNHVFGCLQYAVYGGTVLLVSYRGFVVVISTL